jgi:benzoyl-CoA reductase/2-hydroxyglutaryl-CoA dehydratase subunit BcrC/BadD/HgdB
MSANSTAIYPVASPVLNTGMGVSAMSNGCKSNAPSSSGIYGPLTWFGNMVENCLKYAEAGRQAGKRVVGITCEFTPRELIIAAGGMPVCLCGGVFETIAPAEKYLPSNLCPLIKSTFGFSVTKQNPFLEMADLLVVETTCDGKKKMYEMLGRDKPVHVLELPQKADDPDAMEHWVAELRKLKQRLETLFGAQIDDNSIRHAIRTMNRERALRRDLAALMKSDCPPMTGRELLDMKSIIACMPEDFVQYEKALSMLPGRTLDPPAESRVRVLLTGVPVPHGAEKVVDIVENSGGLIVSQENCTGIKPLLEDVDEEASDPIRALASKYFHLPCSVLTPNTRRMDSLRALVHDYRPDCVIDLIWQACITYDVESFQVRELVTNELGLAYLRIETDYSPSDSAQIAMRVQALFETVRAGSGRERNID